MMKQAKILLGVVLLLVVVIVNGIASWFATRTLVEKNNAVDHTRMVASELDATLIAVLNMEAGERGYLYTGQQPYLEPYNVGIRDVPSHLNRLANLTSDSPVQQQNIRRLRVSVQDTINLFQQAVAFESAGQHQAAKQLVLTGAGRTKIGAVTAVLDDMAFEESRLIAVRKTEAQRSERYLLLTIPASHLFTAILVVIAGLLVSHDLRKHIEATIAFREFAEREHTARVRAEAARQQMKETQAALVRAEKLAAVGRLASSVAHEINNPLEAITNLVWIAKNDPSASESVRMRLGLADEELRRVAHISKQTLGFYRNTSQKKEVKLPEVIDSGFRLYANRIASKEIAVRTKYDDCSVLGNAGELLQLFSNLFANAIDAIQSHGTLCVKTSCGHDWRHSNAPGVRVTIGDDGCGIPAENLATLFEPFFTTKESTGTGLGLWVAKQIAEKHGGRITVRSRATLSKHYTIFSVFLPLGEEERAQELATTAREHGSG